MNGPLWRASRWLEERCPPEVTIFLLGVCFGAALVYGASAT